MSNYAIDSAQISTALGHSPQLPLDPRRGTALQDRPVVPPAFSLLDDTHYRLTFHAPSAREVTVQIAGRPYSLEPGENGVWSVTLPINEGGWKPVYFQVDGVWVINPMLSIGYGSSAPCNLVDLPQPGLDFYHLKDVPHGAVSQQFYHSSVTGAWESCLVYTPPGYMTGTEAYPVLYLQHGHGENERCWTYQGKVNFIADNLIAAGAAVPCIIVMNNGMVPTPDSGGALGTNPATLPELLVKDCIPFIERTYRVKPGRDNRAVAGLSMGSIQASFLSMTHPELFPWVGIFSGFVRSPGLSLMGNSHLKALEDPETFRTQYRLFFRAMGTGDVFLDAFDGDSALLAARGLSPEQWPAHQEVRYPGEHEWNVWRLCTRDFLQNIFR